MTTPIARLPHSPLLALLLQYGGGEIRQSYRGGVGTYVRLEDNALLGRPLPLTRAFDGDVERLYPARFQRQQYPHSGEDLVAMVRVIDVYNHDRELYFLWVRMANGDMAGGKKVPA